MHFALYVMHFFYCNLRESFIYGFHAFSFLRFYLYNLKICWTYNAEKATKPRFIESKFAYQPNVVMPAFIKTIILKLLFYSLIFKGKYHYRLHV